MSFLKNLTTIIIVVNSGATSVRSHIAKQIYQSQKIWWSRDRTPPARPSTPQGIQCSITLSRLFGSTGKLIWHMHCRSMLCSIDSCQNRVSADQYHVIVSRAQVSTHRGRVFLSYPLTSYWLSNHRRLNFIFLTFIWNMLCLCAAQWKFWFQTDLGRENLASYYRQGRQLLLTFLIMVTRWSRSTFNFYALIGQNLTGEFMRKIYAASWNLFTLTAEADRVLCQLVMFLTVFFHWMYKVKFSCYQESSVIHG